MISSLLNKEKLNTIKNKYENVVFINEVIFPKNKQKFKNIIYDIGELQSYSLAPFNNSFKTFPHIKNKILNLTNSKEINLLSIKKNNIKNKQLEEKYLLIISYTFDNKILFIEENPNPNQSDKKLIEKLKKDIFI